MLKFLMWTGKFTVSSSGVGAPCSCQSVSSSWEMVSHESAENFSQPGAVPLEPLLEACGACRAARCGRPRCCWATAGLRCFRPAGRLAEVQHVITQAQAARENEVASSGASAALMCRLTPLADAPEGLNSPAACGRQQPEVVTPSVSGPFRAKEHATDYCYGSTGATATSLSHHARL
jgi:hypothetical protein